jgi:hypothetical protein
MLKITDTIKNSPSMFSPLVYYTQAGVNLSSYIFY